MSDDKDAPHTVIERTDIPGTYLFVYHIDLRDVWNPTCDCKAGTLGNVVCHHILAAMRVRDGETE